MELANGSGDIAAAADLNHGDATVSALLARIALLEAENKQLRDSNQSSTSLSQSRQDMKNRRSSRIYFDGFKTRVEDDDDDDDIIPLASGDGTDKGENSCYPIRENTAEESSLKSVDSSNSFSTEDASRKAAIAHSRRWSSSSVLSSDMDKIHNYADQYEGHCLTLGENRYAKRSSHISEKMIEEFKTSLFNSDGADGRQTKSESGLLSIVGDLESGQTRHSSLPLFAVPREIELFMRMKKLSKRFSSRASFSTCNLMKPSQERLLYDQFAILSIDPTDTSSQWSDKGGRFLDAFALKTAHCIDNYPIQLAGESFVPEELSTFCCLDGVTARLMPQAAVAGAMALGWFADEHKLLAFTDGNGVTAFGIAITVYEEVSADDNEQLLECLQNRQRKRAAASLIIRWWRSHAKKIKSTSVEATKQDKKSMSQTSPKLSHRVKNLVSSPLQQRRKGRDGLHRSFQGGMKKIKKTMTRVSFAGTPSHQNIKSAPRLMTSHEMISIHERTSTSESITSSVSDITRLRAKESFDSMVAERDVIFVQRCYVMIGGDQSQQFLQLRLLKHLIEIDLRKKSKSKLELLPNDETTIRHKYLQGISRIDLSKKQARVRLSSEISIRQQIPTFKIDLPAFDLVDTIPLPLPHVADDWGVAQLFRFLKPEYICSILKLLLVERSLLVVGHSSEVVTSCICALLQLVKPFQWA
eukprot:scaffold13327_cov93-Skeletonema_dohrnii-CCMP3373.AAC.1